MAQGILSYAKLIAHHPPLRTWMMKCGADPELVSKANYDPERFGVDRGGLVAQAGTVCDLNAYALMVIGMGQVRYDRLAEGGTGKVEGDVAQKFSASAALSSFLSEWADLSGGGLMQIKFAPGGTGHTLVLERIPGAADGLSGGYRVYQGYEGIYRLSDFLALTNGEDYVRRRLTAVAEDEPNRTIRERRLAKIDGAVACFQQVRNRVGSAKELGRREFDEWVCAPLCSSLGSGMSAGEYAELVGRPADGSVKSSSVLAIRADSLDPAKFFVHYKSLDQGGNRAPKPEHSPWVEPNDFTTGAQVA